MADPSVTIDIFADTQSANAELKKTSDNLKKVTDATSKVAPSMAQASKATDKIEDSLEDLAKKIGGYVDDQGRLRDANAKFISKQDAANGVVRKSAVSVSKLEGASNKLTKAMVKGSGVSGRFKGKLGGVGAMALKAAKAVGGAALAYVSLRQAGQVVAGVVQTSSQWQQSMAHVKALAEQQKGFTIGAYQEMSAEARRLGATTMFSASQAAEGLKFLSMAGFSAQQSTESLEATLQLAQAGALGLGDSARIVSDVMSAFKADTKDTGRFVDIMAAIAGNANTDVLQLGESFKFAGPLAGALGQDVEEIGGALGTLAQVGVSGSSAGTNIANMLGQMVNKSGRAVRGMAKLGITAEQLDPRINNLSDIIQLMADKGVDGGNAIELFGRQAGRAVTILTEAARTTKGNSNVMKEMVRVTREAEGTAAGMSKTMGDTFPGSIKILRSAWEELQLTIGESGPMDWARNMVNLMTAGVTKLTNAVKFFRDDLSKRPAIWFGEALKLGAMQTVRFLEGGLKTTFSVAGAYFGGLFKVYTTPDYWKGLFQVFFNAGRLLLAGVLKVRAFLINASKSFTVPLIAGMTFGAAKFKGFMMNAMADIVGLFAKGILFIQSEGFGGVLKKIQNGFVIAANMVKIEMTKALIAMLNMLSKIPGIAGKVKDAVKDAVNQNKLTQGENDGLAGDDSLGDKLAKFSDSLKNATDPDATFDSHKKGAEAMIDGIVSSLNTGADIIADGAFAGMKDGAKTAGDVVKSNVVDPVKDAFNNFKPGNDVFDKKDISKQRNKADTILFNHLNDQVKDATEAVKTSANNVTGAKAGDATGEDKTNQSASLNGSLSGALNQILGRSANEVVAANTAALLDKQTEAVEEQKKTNEHLENLDPGGKFI